MWLYELEDNLGLFTPMAERAAGRRGFLPGYFEGLQLKETKERYLES